MAILEVKGLKKIYTTRFGGNQVQALSNVSFSVEEGEYVAIMGESGSGKTTLLNILAALDKPTNGEVVLDGKILAQISEKEISAFRRDNLGFVFQDFNLLDNFSIQDNIFLPLVLARTSYVDMKKRMLPIVKKLKIEDILNKYPYEVSGGQKQRVSIARAILKDAPIVVFDEATSYSDIENEHKIQLALQNLLQGKTTIMIAHRLHTIRNADHIVVFEDGKAVEQGTHDELVAREGRYSHMWDTYIREMVGKE